MDPACFGPRRPMLDVDQLTTQHVQDAIAGDSGSQAWLIQRFSGMIRAQARSLLAGGRWVDGSEEEVEQEVWLRTLPRLKDLRPQDGRLTPVIMTFLGQVVVRTCSEFRRRQARELPDAAPDARIDVESRRAVSAAMDAEASQLVLRAIEDLDAIDREILIMRLMEGASNSLAAESVGLSASAVTRRFQSTLDTLRRRLPGGLFDACLDAE